MFAHLVDTSYLAVKPETTENVPVKPNVFIPLESSDLKVDMGYAPDRRMRGVDFETNDLSPGERQIRGNIKVWGDPDMIGHILNMCMQKGSTTGDITNGFVHTFTPGNTVKSYTIEIPRGNYAHRFFGVKGGNLQLNYEDAKLKASLDVIAAGQFSSAKLGANTSGGATTLTLSQDYDLEPVRGLAVGDVLTVGVGTAGQEDVTLTSVNANGIGLGFTAMANPHTAGDIVMLKKQTVSNQVLQRPFMFGDTVVGFGATASAADTAAAAKTTATPVYDLSIEYNTDLLAGPTTNYRDPSVILPQVKSCVLETKQLYETPAQHTNWLNDIKQAITVICRGKNLGSNRYQLRWTLHKALLEDNAEPLNVGQYVYDEQRFRAAYDDTDGKALTVELTNATAAANY